MNNITKCFLILFGLLASVYSSVLANSNICEEDWYLPSVTPVNLSQNDLHWKITCDCDCSMKSNEIMLIKWNDENDNLTVLMSGTFSSLLVLNEDFKNGLKPISILRKIPNKSENKSLPYVFESYRFEFDGKNYVLFQSNNDVSDRRLVLGGKKQSELFNSGILKTHEIDIKKETAVKDFIRRYITSGLNESYNKALSAFKKKNIDASSKYSLEIAKISPWRFLVLDTKTLNIFNDLGFFLEQGNQYNKSIEVLTYIVSKVPDRVVAYINLGDAYYGNNEIDKAKHAYQTYISLMKKTGKQKRIPKRVYDRLK